MRGNQLTFLASSVSFSSASAFYLMDMLRISKLRLVRFNAIRHCFWPAYYLSWLGCNLFRRDLSPSLSSPILISLTITNNTLLLFELPQRHRRHHGLSALRRAGEKLFCQRYIRR